MSLLFTGPCANAVGGRSSWSGIPPAPLNVERQDNALPSVYQARDKHNLERPPMNSRAGDANDAKGTRDSPRERAEHRMSEDPDRDDGELRRLRAEVAAQRRDIHEMGDRE